MQPSSAPGRRVLCAAVAGAVSLALAAGPAAAQPAAAPATAPGPDAPVGASWTLDAAIARAVARSEQLVAADARREAADARVDRARAALLPTISATASATRRAREVTSTVGGEEITIQSAYALSAQATAAFPLLDLRGRAALRQVRLEEDAARLDAEEARRRLALDVAATYLAALGAEQVVAAAERRAAYAAERLADARARAAAGLTSTSDVTGAELEVATARREAADAAAALAVSYEQLAYLVDAEVTGPLAAPAELLAAATATVELAAEARRLDLEAATRRVEAAEAAASIPGLGAWPTLDLAGQVRASNEPGFAGEYHDWSVSILATWLLWDGGARRAETRELEATVRAAAAEVAAARRAASTEVDTARIRLDGARAVLREAEDAAAAAARYADEIATLYAQGLARALEVIDAGARRFDAEVALARARYDVGAAYLELLAATGATLMEAR